MARIEVADGDVDAALHHADEAVEWIEQSDQIDSVGEFRAVRAEVLLSAGRIDAARADLVTALKAYERKGSRTGVRRIRSRLAALPASPST